ncbi:MAG TPA: TlpA disulfide reductase family protein [Candidatus Angelobacter sp.]
MKSFLAMVLLISPVFSSSAPNLELKDAQGNVHHLAQYRGKIVVLNFWATWCVPCKTEMPIFVDVYKKYRDRGVVVLAASMDDESTRRYVSQYAHVYKMEFPILVDASSDTMHALGLGEGLPSTVFFDSNGDVVGKILGQAQKKDVLKRIEWLLGNHEGQPPQPVTDTLRHK